MLHTYIHCLPEWHSNVTTRAIVTTQITCHCILSIIKSDAEKTLPMQLCQITIFWQIFSSYCKFSISRPLNWGKLGAIIFFKNILKKTCEKCFAWILSLMNSYLVLDTPSISKSWHEKIAVLNENLRKKAKQHYHTRANIDRSWIQAIHKGPFTNYVSFFWNFLTTYAPSLHFLYSKLHIFLTTYPP